MTTFSLDNNQAKYQIRAFAPGQIQVNDTLYHRSLIISAQTLIENWTPVQASEITADALATILPLSPTILLIGTGKTQEFIPLEIYGELLNQAIGVEIMSTAAACRTYNALTAEDRKVAAALIL